MSTVRRAAGAFRVEAEVLLVGAGAAGLCAALAASEAGAEVLSSSATARRADRPPFRPASYPPPATRFQRDLGIEDTAACLPRYRDKAHDEADPRLVALVAREAGPTVEWLADNYGLPFSVVHDFDYPGHSVRRMHGLPSRSGAELIDRLRAAVETADATLVTERDGLGLVC